MLQNLFYNYSFIKLILMIRTPFFPLLLSSTIPYNYSFHSATSIKRRNCDFISI